MPRVAQVELPQLKLCKCVSCSEIATSWDGYCPRHAGYRPLKSYSSRPRVSRNAKDPIGVELEMYNPQSIYRLTNVARYVCSDGSLPAGGGEVKLCSTAKKISAIAADTAQRARIAGAEVNKKCGFHVHMSLPEGFHRGSYYHRTEGYLRLYNFANKLEDKFFAIMPPSRKNNQYCVRFQGNDSGLSSHYSWLSLSDRVPTVELRIHGGTTNPWKVKAWIEFCINLRQVIHKVISGESVPEDAAAVESLADFCPTGSLAAKYIKAREESPSLEKFVF